MKKPLFTCLFICALEHSNAREFSIGIAPGYAFPTTYLFEQKIDSRSPWTSASFGSGFKGTLSTDYMISDFFGLELGFIFGFTNKRSITYDTSSFEPSPYPHGLGGGRSYDGTITDTWKTGLPILTDLSAMIRIPLGGINTLLYFKGGVVMPLQMNIRHERSEKANYEVLFPLINTSANDYHLYAYKSKYSTRFSLGYSASVAVKTLISEHLNGLFFIGELRYTSLSVRITKIQTTEYTVDGEDKLNSLYSYQQNSTSIGQYANFKSIGLNAGLSYTIPSKKRSRSALP